MSHEEELNYVMSCHVMSCHVMSCHVMSCHVMSCHVMSCHVMSCHVTSCQMKQIGREDSFLKQCLTGLEIFLFQKVEWGRDIFNPEFYFPLAPTSDKYCPVAWNLAHFDSQFTGVICRVY